MNINWPDMGNMLMGICVVAAFRGGQEDKLQSDNKLCVTQSMVSRQETNSPSCPSSTPPQSPCTFPL